MINKYYEVINPEDPIMDIYIKFKMDTEICDVSISNYGKYSNGTYKTWRLIDEFEWVYAHIEERLVYNKESKVIRKHHKKFLNFLKEDVNKYMRINCPCTNLYFYYNSINTVTCRTCGKEHDGINILNNMLQMYGKLKELKY